ncbi:MAG TPA: hypothetical protein VNY05_36480 [Candidatus Acidoferrales bacterium]|jgi:hypothetical protein|nr:hypothetical protein [Candidatus Acidoferrales bacterium]
MNFIGCVLMAAVTFPLSYYLAWGCLRGLLRLFRMGAAAELPHRNVL